MAVTTGPAITPDRTIPRHPPAPVQRALGALAAWLAAHSITVLRISLGLVFLAFGALKFVPGASPAGALAARTLDTLSLGLVSGADR